MSNTSKTTKTTEYESVNLYVSPQLEVLNVCGSATTAVLSCFYGAHLASAFITIAFGYYRLYSTSYRSSGSCAYL